MERSCHKCSHFTIQLSKQKNLKSNKLQLFSQFSFSLYIFHLCHSIVCIKLLKWQPPIFWVQFYRGFNIRFLESQIGRILIFLRGVVFFLEERKLGVFFFLILCGSYGLLVIIQYSLIRQWMQSNIPLCHPCFHYESVVDQTIWWDRWFVG